MNSLNQIFKHINQLDAFKLKDTNSAAFQIGKMRSEYTYMTASEIQSNVKGFVENTLDNLVEISAKLEKEYFDYW